MTEVVHQPACLDAHSEQGEIVIRYADDKIVRFPVSVNHRLRGRSEAELNHIEIGYFGLHWPALDEDLSHEGLRAGRFGQP